MNLNKVFHFLKGYVILTVTGFNIERFLYICAKRGIDVWNIDRKDELRVSMSIEDFCKLKQVVRKTRVRVHIKKKMGLPIILKRYRKRHFMFFGVILFFLTVFISSQFIWSVEINGVEKADMEEIKRVLEESGVSVGTFKGRVLPSKEIKNILLNRVDNISWAWVYLKGTKAVCEIYEDTVAISPLESGEPCDIVASCDGIIKRVIAKNGIRIVKPGETVLAGDVLISGSLPDDEGNVGCVVEASGITEAYTWYEETDTYKLYYESEIPTGRTKNYYRLNVFSNKVNLFFKQNHDFENYSSEKKVFEAKFFGGKPSGISVEKENLYEVEIIREAIPYDTAVYDGRRELEERIAKKITPGAELVNSEVLHRRIDDETVEVTVTMEFIENIGKKAPISNLITEE